MTAASVKKGSEGPPKRPVTAFFLFKSEEAEKGNKMNAKDAGKLWKELSEDKKQPYVDRYNKAKEAYDKYMVEVEGVSPKKSGKPTGFSQLRVKAICTKDKKIQSMDAQVYRAIAKILVLKFVTLPQENFFEDLGKTVGAALKEECARVTTLDIMEKAVEEDPRLAFVASKSWDGKGRDAGV